MSVSKKNRVRLRALVLMAVFAALAFAAMFVFRFNVTFLTFDLKDSIITMSGLLLGPVAAAVVSLLVATLEFITIGDTGWYGFLMNFASSATFSVVCALVTFSLQVWVQACSMPMASVTLYPWLRISRVWALPTRGAQ